MRWPGVSSPRRIAQRRSSAMPALPRLAAGGAGPACSPSGVHDFDEVFAMWYAISTQLSMRVKAPQRPDCPADSEECYNYVTTRVLYFTPPRMTVYPEEFHVSAADLDCITLTAPDSDRCVRIALRYGEDGTLIGFGGVNADGQRLRSEALPWQLRAETPDGIAYARFAVDGLERRADGGATLRLRAIGSDTGQREYRDEYGMAQVTPVPHAEPIEDTLSIHFTPCTLELGQRHWFGFSYQFHFQSEGRQLHRLRSHESWELGGAIDGNTVLHRGHCNMPVYRGDTDTRFTTYCLKALHEYGNPQGFSYQQGARGGLVQPFDFQHGEAGALLAYWPQLDAVHSFLDSPEGCRELRTVDEYRVALASDVTTPAKHVLFTPGALAEHEARNLWWDAHQFVFGGIQSRFHIRPSVVRPQMRPARGGDLRHTSVDNDTFRIQVDGELVPAHEALYVVADRIVPKLAANGIPRLWSINVHETDVTALGMRRKLEFGINGDLNCASACATHRFFPSDFWGGIDAWRYLVKKAHERGIAVGAWFAPHFSPRAPIFKQHPEWLLTGPDSKHWGGGYGFKTIVTADWNTGVYDWVLSDLKQWKAEGGLDFLFTDSWPNLGLLPHNFSARMRTNDDALGRFYADLQSIGIENHLFEGISPYGASRFGVWDLRNETLGEQGGFAGQNDFGWWVGEEDMAHDILMHTTPRQRDEAELERIQFRLMANRGTVNYHLHGDNHDPYQLPAWWVRLNRIYTQALPHMISRRLLPDQLGVSWTDGTCEVLWAYRDGHYDIPAGAYAEQLEGTDTRALAHASALPLSAGCVYRIHEPE